MGCFQSRFHEVVAACALFASSGRERLVLVSSSVDLGASSVWVFARVGRFAWPFSGCALVCGFAAWLSGFGVQNKVTWLILPVVICLSQRLSHACLSINNFIL